MTNLYFTIDTEYSPAVFRRSGAAGRAENFASSILGRTREGDAGIVFEMDVLDRHGLKAVFFVDPMPALVWGVAAIADVVGPIVARGHDVQMHLHSEWLEFAGANNPVQGRTGRDIQDFTFDDQCKLLDYAREVLVAAGAPVPVAFRAGNYGASDDTLRALAALGVRYDSSHCPGIVDAPCAISLDAEDRDPVEHCGVIEVPIGCIQKRHGHLRHFQLTALTDVEICAALRYAARLGQDSMTLVSHSFELLSRDRRKINRIVRRRFESLCVALEKMPRVTTATYADHPPMAGTQTRVNLPLPHNPLRTLHRYTEQALGNLLYGAR